MDLARYLSAIRNNRKLGIGLALLLLFLCFMLRYYSPLQLTYVTFYPSIMLATLAAGRSTGILITLMAAALAVYFFRPDPDPGTFAMTATDIWNLGAFLIVSLIIIETTNILAETLVLAAEKTRKIAEQAQAIARSEHMQRTLLREISHRMKNQYAVILAMASATGRSAASVGEYQQVFSNRLHSLSRAHDLLIQGHWKKVPIADLLDTELTPFGADGKGMREGPPLHLTDVAVVNLGMALHELATNSAKHGAWRGAEGAVHIRWREEGGQFILEWREDFGRPAEKTSRKGFGSVVLEQVVPTALEGSAVLEITAQGVAWRLQCPASVALAGDAAPPGVPDTGV